MKFAVYEYNDTGARYFISYKENSDCPDNVTLIDKVNTTKEAQEIVDETEFHNWSMFWNGSYSL